MAIAPIRSSLSTTAPSKPSRPAAESTTSTRESVSTTFVSRETRLFPNRTTATEEPAYQTKDGGTVAPVVEEKEPDLMLRRTNVPGCTEGASRAVVVRVIAKTKPITSRVNPETGDVEATGSYSLGVIQGLQRALGSYVPGIAADGSISQETVDATISVLESIGLPRGMDSMPTNAQEIAQSARLIAEHIAESAGVQPNFIPGEVEPPPIGVPRLTLVASKAPEPGTLFSKRNLTIGALLFGGFVILNR